MLTDTPEVTLSENPDRLIMYVSGLRPGRARTAANIAVAEARRNGPKATGRSMERLQPIYGKGYFGVRWADPYVWFQEHGAKPFTMRNLAGKTIPMWISDPTGTVRLKNPKAPTMIDKNGVVKVKIFRRAAKQGARITKYRTDRKTGERVVASDRPASYPGAPGRISSREAGSPSTTVGRVAGAISRGNGGVRWRHPGLTPRLFINNGITQAAQRVGIIPVRIYVADSGWRAHLHPAETEDDD